VQLIDLGERSICKEVCFRSLQAMISCADVLADPDHQLLDCLAGERRRVAEPTSHSAYSKE
jgi:hypothetical protein